MNLAEQVKKLRDQRNHYYTCIQEADRTLKAIVDALSETAVEPPNRHVGRRGRYAAATARFFAQNPRAVVTPSDVAKATGMSVRSAGIALPNWMRRGRVLRVARGKYRIVS